MSKTLLYSATCAIFAFVGGCHGTQVPSQTNPPPSASKVSDPSEEQRALAALLTTRGSRTKEVSAKKPDQASLAEDSPKSDERFPNTPVGLALHKHVLILVDISTGADERKESSLAELRKNPKEASQALLAAYHAADPKDFFGRWLLTLTLSELHSNEAYLGLREIAYSRVPADLKDNDLQGNQLSNESAIRQTSVSGLTLLARAGNSAAEKDLLGIAVNTPTKDDAVRTVAIKGYLSAGRDYAARVQTLKAQLPSQYHDVVTLTVSQPEEPAAPAVTRRPKNGR